jgi:hypothetical protein
MRKPVVGSRRRRAFSGCAWGAQTRSSPAKMAIQPPRRPPPRAGRITPKNSEVDRGDAVGLSAQACAVCVAAMRRRRCQACAAAPSAAILQPRDDSLLGVPGALPSNRNVPCISLDERYPIYVRIACRAIACGASWRADRRGVPVALQISMPWLISSSARRRRSSTFGRSSSRPREESMRVRSPREATWGRSPWPMCSRVAARRRSS